MSYGADELREGILELFEEASERSRYFMAFEERETIQTVRWLPKLEPLINTLADAKMPVRVPTWEGPTAKAPRVRHRKFSSTHKVKDLRGLKAHAGSCPVCNARAREHRCPGW